MKLLFFTILGFCVSFEHKFLKHSRAEILLFLLLFFRFFFRFAKQAFSSIQGDATLPESPKPKKVDIAIPTDTQPQEATQTEVLQSDEEDQLANQDTRWKLNNLQYGIGQNIQIAIESQFERAKIPIYLIHDLDVFIQSQPFTDEEIKKLENLRLFAAWGYGLVEKLISRFTILERQRKSEFLRIPGYDIMPRQKQYLDTLLDQTAEQLSDEVKAIDEIMSQDTMKKAFETLESERDVIVETLQNLIESLDQAMNEKLDKTKVLAMKADSVKKLAEVSNRVMGILESESLQKSIDVLSDHVEDVINIMIHLPVKINTSYMI